MSRAPPNNPRMMPSHMSGPHGQVRMDQQWPPHPSHYQTSQGMAMYNSPAHQQAAANSSSFMSLPGQQYRGHRGYPGEYGPPRSPDGN